MDWRTKLLNPDPQARQDYTSLATPVYRGSTVVFKDQASVTDDWQQAENGYSYGLYGTPTTLELASRIAGLEGAANTLIVPGGQAAIALIYFAYCTSGSHALVPYSAYGPNKAMAEGMLKGLGIEVEPYDPLIGAGIVDLIRENSQAFKVDFGFRCEFAKRRIDLVSSVDAGRVKVPTMIDVGWLFQTGDIFGSTVQERQRSVATRDHQRHIKLARDGLDHAGKRIFLKPDFDIRWNIRPQSFSVELRCHFERIGRIGESLRLALPAGVVGQPIVGQLTGAAHSNQIGLNHPVATL